MQTMISVFYEYFCSMKRILLVLMVFMTLTGWAQEMHNVGRLTTANGLPDNSVFCLFIDSHGLLWIGTDDGLGRYDGHDVRTIHKYTDPQGIDHPLGAVRHISEKTDGNLMLDVGNIEMAYDRASHRVISTEKGIKRHQETVFHDRRNGVWVYKYDNDSIRYQATDSVWQTIRLGETAGNAVQGMADDGQGHLWIVTDHSGLYQVDQTMPGINIRHYPLDYNLSSIACDAYGTLWMGDNKRGVLFWNPAMEVIRHYNSPSWGANTLLVAHDGRLWTGTDGHGVFADGHYCFLDGKLVTALAEDASGRIWTGTYGDGLFVDGEKVEAVGNRKVSTINIDAMGRVWVGSHFDPLVCYNPTENHCTEVKTVKGDDIYALSATTDLDGNVLFGTYYGIMHIDAKSGQQQLILSAKSGEEFLSKQSNSLLVDRRGIIWMGHLNGITMWNPATDEVRSITQEHNGLSEGRVRSMVTDKRGRIIVATSKGFSAIIVNTKGEVENIATYNSPLTMGLQSPADSYSDITLTPNAVGVMPDGQPVFGTTFGYVTIDLEKLFSPDRDNTQVAFSEIVASGQLLDENADAITLRHDDYNITIHLFTNHLHDASLCRYAYRVEGMYGDWIIINDPVISFGMLPAGSYELNVKAQIAGGKWSDVKKLRITVEPPFWASATMKVLYALVILALIVWIVLRYRHRQQEKMERQRREMEMDNQILLSDAKLRFFTNISHDLRTPLTLIVSPLQSLLKEQHSESVSKRLHIIDKNANLLMQQISSLLDFRKLDAGAERLNATQGDLVEIARTVCDEFVLYAKERGIMLHFEHKPEGLQCSLDVEKIQKVMYNLLSNAFKFTDAGGSIKVMVDTDGEQAIVSVADEGCGVSDKDKPHLFERFYQSNTNEQQPGSGIGLHIVSEYVRLHGGTVLVTDNKPHGAVFTFCLPVISEAMGATTQQTAPMNQEDTEEAMPDGKYTILFVDDNHDLCDFVSDALAEKYHILTANDGVEALELLAQKNVNLVVSDVMMPRMNGLELCNRIKGDIQLSHIPVLLLTAKTAEASVIEGLQMGADDYLTKPFNIDVLQLRIEKFIEWSQRAHQTFQQKIEVEPSEITITPLDEQFIARAIKIVEDHLTDTDFTVETLGSELAMNRVSLWRKIQNLTGRGPADFIRTIRLKRGKQLLKKSQMQVSEIAYTVGYNTVKRFTENFKAEFGMTPTQYRNHLQDRV